jgi:hypothetical protein
MDELVAVLEADPMAGVFAALPLAHPDVIRDLFWDEAGFATEWASEELTSEELASDGWAENLPPLPELFPDLATDADADSTAGTRSPVGTAPGPDPSPDRGVTAGPGLGASVAGDLGADELLDQIAASVRRAGEAVTELTARPAAGAEALHIGARVVADELACELTLTTRTAENLVFQAVGMALEAPDTLDALARGDIDLPKAQAILDLVQTLLNPDADERGPDDGLSAAERQERARRLQEKLLTKAPEQTVANLKKTGNRELIKVDPGAAERRHARKRERRHVTLSPEGDSMCRLIAYLPAAQGARIMAGLTALAHDAHTPRRPPHPRPAPHRLPRRGHHRRRHQPQHRRRTRGGRRVRGRQGRGRRVRGRSRRRHGRGRGEQ